MFHVHETLEVGDRLKLEDFKNNEGQFFWVTPNSISPPPCLVIVDQSPDITEDSFRYIEL